MKQIILTLLAALLPAIASADVVAYYTTGQSLYARFDDASNTAVNLTEGSSLKLGRYVAADAAIDSAGLAAGTYSARILIGTAGAQASGDVEVAVVPEFMFNGTIQVTSTDEILEAIDDIEGGGGGSATPIAPITVSKTRTWVPDQFDPSRAANTITIKGPFAKTLAAELPLNDDGDLAAIASVTCTPPSGTVTPNNFKKTGDGRTIHFDVGTLTTVGTYIFDVTGTTVDDQTISMRCKLVLK